MVDSFSKYVMNEKVIYSLTKRLRYTIRDISKLGYPNPYQPNEIIIDDSIGVTTKIIDDIIWITNVTLIDKRTKHTLDSIHKIFDIAKEYDIRIGLNPFPAKEAGFNANQLLKWFTKLGVIRQGGKYMWEPHTSK